MDTTKTITHLSLCSGYSGIGLGLKRVLPNLREIAHVEIEAFAVANLVSKMESEQIHTAPIFTNVKTFPYERFSGCVDILSGGFPCQPFSQAGARKGVEDPRHLYPYISRGIRECKPRIVFLENVEGIISSKTADGESVLKYVLEDLESMGYRAMAGVFSASEVGAPHQRKRVFIMGYSTSERCEGERLRIQQRQEGRVSGGTGEELGHTQYDVHAASTKSREVSGSQEEGRLQESSGRSDELSDTISKRSRGGQPSRSGGMDKTGGEAEKEGETPYNIRSKVEGCGGELPNTDSQGLEGLRECDTSEGWQTPNGQPRSYCEAWPARPNECQYEWEEPRTKPKLGRTAHGTASRVDRLRLLGNGVVPATAARAFKVLIGRLID